MTEYTTVSATTWNDTSCEGVEFTYSPMVVSVSVVIMVIWMILICGGNGFILLAFVRSKRLRTITNFYIVTLAISDFGLGCMLPYILAGFLDTSFLLKDIKACVFYFVGTHYFGTASIWGLGGLTFDRYLAITSPLRYTSVMTRKRYVVSGLVLWVTPTVMSLIIPMLWHHNFDVCPDCRLEVIMEADFFRYLLIPGFTLVSVAMVIMYAHIFVIARKQMSTIMAQEQTLSTNGKSNTQRTFQKQWKLVKSGLIVFAAFYLCWLPYILTVGVIMYQTDPDKSGLSVIRLFTSFMGVLNSSLNPFIYTYRLPAFKYEFKRIFSKVRPLREDESINSVGPMNRTMVVTQHN